MKLKDKAKIKAKQFIGIFPHNLPHTEQELQAFNEKIFSTYNFTNIPAHQGAIAQMILELPSTVCKKPLSFFAKSVKKRMSNQAAFDTLQFLKKIEKEKLELEAAQQKQLQATADQPSGA